MVRKTCVLFLLFILLTSCRTHIASVSTTFKETISVRDTIIKAPLPKLKIDKQLHIDTLIIKPITIQTPTSTITLKVKDNILDVGVVNTDSIDVKVPIIEKKVESVTEKVVVKKQTPKLVILIIGILVALIIVLCVRIKL